MTRRIPILSPNEDLNSKKLIYKSLVEGVSEAIEENRTKVKVCEIQYQNVYVTVEKEDWKTKTQLLTGCFHSYVNLHSTQMFSYLKNLDIAEEKITFTFFGNIKNINGLHNYIKKNYLTTSTILYKKNEIDYVLVCKNKTCSLPIKKLSDLEEYLKKNSIN